MSECDHDFRRVAYSHVNPAYGNGPLAVLCCNCGRSPVTVLTTWVQGTPLPRFKVSGDWPDDHKITDWAVDDSGIPSVEFEIVSGDWTDGT